MPLVVDIVQIDTATGEGVWMIEAMVDLVNGEPAATQIHIHNRLGIDPVEMSRDFRWGSPVEIVRRVLPALMADGVDIWTADLPLNPMTEVNDSQGRLSDEFLRGIARQYLELGPEYARVIAAERGVSPRTVIGWIAKARKRGILTGTTRGHVGGEIRG